MRITRLHALVAAGLVDSFGLALGWTVFMVYAVQTQGLAAAGSYGAAVLLGVALSAASTSWLAGHLNGSQLLRTTACSEAVLRVVTFGLLLVDAPVAAVASAVALTNVMAWTAYAGMRAEVAAVDSSARTMTMYVTAIASIEAVGVAIGALLPIDFRDSIANPLLVAVIALYATSLIPTLVVAHDSRIGPSQRTPGGWSSPEAVKPLAAGFAIMALASGPTLLSTALALELHGRIAIVAAALAFTTGALLAPQLAAWIARRGFGPGVTWPALGIGMLIGWIVAPWHLIGLVLAQTLAGISMTAFEGIMDARVAEQASTSGVTARLARAAAARALGSAFAVGLAPIVIASGSLAAMSGLFSAPLTACLLCGIVLLLRKHRTAPQQREVLQRMPEPTAATLA